MTRTNAPLSRTPEIVSLWKRIRHSFLGGRWPRAFFCADQVGSAMKGWPLVRCLILSIVGCSVAEKIEDPRPNFVASRTYHEALRKFTGESFQTVYVDAIERKYYLGAKNIFYVFNDPFDGPSNARNYTWPATSEAVRRCSARGTPRWECENYIAVLLPNHANGGFLACGTNAQAPLCRYFKDAAALIDYEEVNGVTRCPFLPDQKSTALFVNGTLFSATIADLTARSALFSTSVRGRILMKSPRWDSSWLKLPDFVASFEMGDWIVLFFRERGVESGNADETVYSRVAKVCKNDNGGEWISAHRWTTFQKARLNCSFGGALPFYFHHLRDVVAADVKDDVVFYGLFTTGDHEIPGSAVCSFRLSAIRNIFDDGQFKGRRMGVWYAVPRQAVPAPRPGACVTDSTSQRDEILKFISEHPIMDSSVANGNSSYPLFHLTRADFRLTQIAAHRIGNVDVLFLASDDGRVLKVAPFRDERGDLRSDFLEEIHIAAGENILNLEVVEDGKYGAVLLAQTNGTVVRTPVERCNDLPACACRRDPYCELTSICAGRKPTRAAAPPDPRQAGAAACLDAGQSTSPRKGSFRGAANCGGLMVVGWTSGLVSLAVALVGTILWCRRERGIGARAVFG